MGSGSGMNAVRRPTIFQQHRAALTTIARRCGPIRREAHRVSIQVEIQNAISELTEDILEEEDAAPVEVALLLTLALMRGEIPHVEVRF